MELHDDVLHEACTELEEYLLDRLLVVLPEKLKNPLLNYEPGYEYGIMAPELLDDEIVLKVYIKIPEHNEIPVSWRLKRVGSFFEGLVKDGIGQIKTVASC